MKAVVMAGGSGSRLRPLTIARPKALVPVVNKPVLAYILELLKRHGFEEVVITVQHLADQIQDHFGDGNHLGLTIHYSVEEVPLGTAGSVRQARQFLDDTFLVISGDAITDIDLGAVIRFHRARQALATVTLYHVSNPLDYGVVVTEPDGRVVRFFEKPNWGQVISDTVNTGIYVLEPEVLDWLEPNRSYDFSQDVLPLLLKRGAPLYGYIADGYWCDIGTLPAYMRATADVLEGKVRYVDLGRHQGGGIWVGQGVEIAPDAALFGPIYLGDEVKVKEGTILYGPVVVRDHTMLDRRSQLERAVVWNNCYIGESCEIRGAVVGSQCNIKAKSVVLEGAVIGDNSLIGRGAVIHQNVKIWPGKEVEAGAIVRNSIIWGAQGRRVLFGQYGVTGAVNVDLTPEFAARLGAAFGTTLPKGSLVTINRDPHRSPRMLKRAIIAGLPSTGVNVWDLGTQPLAVARYFTCHSEAAAGVHVRVSPYDARMVDIRFTDSMGVNLSDDQQRRMEQIFFREDFRRVYLNEIGTISYAPGVVQRYTRDFLAYVDQETVRRQHFYLVVDYANSPVASVLPGLLSELNCNVVALNANIDESRMAISHEELQADLTRLARIAGALNTHLGVRIDVAGERISVIDDTGQILPSVVLAMALIELALRSSPGAAIAVSMRMPAEVERIAARYGGQIVRTKLDPFVAPPALQQPIILAADGAGNFIFPQFQTTSDGLMATAKLLEYLAIQEASLSQVVAGLPPYHMAHRSVACPWEVKGMVMRRISQHFQREQIDTTDGIRIRFNEDEWALLVSDPDYPLFQVYAEARTEAQVAELVADFTQLITDLQD